MKICSHEEGNNALTSPNQYVHTKSCEVGDIPMVAEHYNKMTYLLA